MSHVKDAVERFDAVIESTAIIQSNQKSAGSFSFGSSGSQAQSIFGDPTQRKSRKSFEKFHGWVHSAVNALAMAAAKQPVVIAKRTKTDDSEKRAAPGSRKDLRREQQQKRADLSLEKDKSAWIKSRMTKTFASKHAEMEVEILSDHFLVSVLENPNPYQSRWDFVYTFICNLVLTGYAYLVYGVDDDGKAEMYCIPTSWIKPVHKDGPFSHYKIIDPKNPEKEVSEDELIDGSQVAFSRIPNPNSLEGSMSPADAQTTAISIDSKIQTSQHAFFDNGIFPSVIMTVGTNPHPDAQKGVRPRLTNTQRNQVNAVIRKLSQGMYNYGNPAIVDGLIEKIERVSATQNEMGWDKSEKSVRARILSAFAVHPFILGESMAGSYAQAYTVYELFYDKVNCFLDLLGSLVSELIESHQEEGSDVFAFWEKCKPTDPSMEKSLWEKARDRDDITQNEFRSFMGLPPDEDANQSVISKSLATPVYQAMQSVAKGEIQPDQAVAYLIGLGVPSDLAEDIIGDGPPQEEEPLLEDEEAAPEEEPLSEDEEAAPEDEEDAPEDEEDAPVLS